jgi:RNA polymerase sigma-70 factor (ECF subfamily)
MDHQRDEDLMAQVAQGDSGPLEPLVRRHAQPLLTFLVRMIGNHHRAEELFQEVFLAVWVKRRTYQHPRPFRPWLYAIAVNRCRADLRLKTPKPLALIDEGPADDDGPDAALLAAEAAEEVTRAVTKLPHQQRAVVVLRVWQDLSYARIAEIVGCTEATARSHMHLGLAALRATLTPLVSGDKP